MELMKDKQNWLQLGLGVVLAAALGAGITYFVMSRPPNWSGSEAVVSATLEKLFVSNGATSEQAEKLAPCVGKALVEQFAQEGACCLAPPKNEEEVVKVLTACSGPQAVLVIMQCAAQEGIGQ